MSALTNAFSSEYGWTAGPALNIVTKAGGNALRRRRAVHGPALRDRGEEFLDEQLLSAVGDELRHAEHADIDQPRRRARRPQPGVGVCRRRDREGQDVLLRGRRLHAPGSHGVSLEPAAGVRAAGERRSVVRGPVPPGPVRRPRRSTHQPGADADRPRQHRPLLRHESAGRRRRHERTERGSQVLARRVVGAGESQRRPQPEPAERGALQLPQRRSGDEMGSAGRSRRRTRARDRCRSPSASRESRICTATRLSCPTR